ncbi:MAG: DUF3568 domain-containing protein [Candidatus Omnitrophica bacterium]|nr:DUF3568 domain-containing protein [Candidatus Omnitrophota bacterium]MBU1924097.1 DUF3568 domain-containing protein [Candidatus Omnitrophota bacterium]
MFKKLIKLIFAVFLTINLYGCMVAMIFVSENLKVKQDLNVSYSQAFDIVKGAVIEQGIKFDKALIEKDVARINGNYAGKSVHIFIHKISDSQCTIAVRVGTSEAERKIAEGILQAIIDYAKRK